MSRHVETFVKQIERLGLTASEAKAYLTVVKSGPCTALQIAGRSALQRTKIYNLMPRLVRLGLIEETLDRPKRYRAVEPQIGLASLAKHSVRQAESVTTTARQLVSALKSLEGESVREAKPEVRILSGVSRLRAHFHGLVKSAQKEVWMMSGRRPILGTKRSEIAGFLRIISSRHLRARLITELDPVTASSLRDQIPLVEIRHCQELRSGLYGVDDRVVALGLSSSTSRSPEQATYLVLTHPECVKIMHSFYEAFWDNTIPFEAWVAGRDEAPDKRYRSVIWGREQLYALLADWRLKAKKWMLSYMPSENGPARVCAYHKERIIEARTQGVRTQSLCHITRGNLAAVKEMCRFTEVRHTEASPMIGFGVLDESEAVVWHIQSDTPSMNCPSDISVHVIDRDETCRLVELFNLLWEHSTPAEKKIQELSRNQPSGKRSG